MIDDLVTRIAGEHISSIVLIKGEVDPHSYELVKGDDEKISHADLVFANGLGLEHTASLQYALTHRDQVYFLGDRAVEASAGRALYVDGVLDPHIWMDVSLWIEVIDPIVEGLSRYDEAHAAEYRERGEGLKAELRDIDQQIYTMMQAIPAKQRYLVTSHDAFNYFARRYLADGDELKSDAWQVRFQAPEGLSPDGQLGMHDIEQIIDHLQRHQIGYIFPESNVGLDSLKKIHAVAGARGHRVHFAKTPLFGDSMSGDGMEASSYSEMLMHNARVIEGYLNATKVTE